jgi:hypothetical protein
MWLMPEMRRREYDKRINNEGDVARIRFTTRRGEIIRYTVQYEIMHDGGYHAAVRYDNAHGMPHRDTLGWSGETVEIV